MLHCNKAAALHEQGHYIEAVVQCCIAESYDGGYSRVYQRRAEAYSSLGDYTAALRVRVCVGGGRCEWCVSGVRGHDAFVLLIWMCVLLGMHTQYTITKQDMQVVAKTVKSADVSRRVSQLQRKTSRQGPVNYYAVLGVPSNAPVADIKAAYRCVYGGGVCVCT